MKGARLLWRAGRTQLLRARRCGESGPTIPPGTILQWVEAPNNFRLEAVPAGAVYAVVPTRTDAQAMTNAAGLAAEWRGRQWW